MKSNYMFKCQILKNATNFCFNTVFIYLQYCSGAEIFFSSLGSEEAKGKCICQFIDWIVIFFVEQSRRWGDSRLFLWCSHFR